MKKHPLLLILGLAATLGLVSLPARADDIFPTTVNIGADVEGGFQVSYGFCPCLRWSVRVDLLNGEIETRDFLISTDALFQYAQTETPRMFNAASRSFRMGAIEALVKGAHVGLAFDGVTVGEDLDRSYNDIIKTGFEVFVSILRTEALRLDIRSGYEFNSLHVNDGPVSTRNLLTESIAFRWRTKSGRISGSINGTVYADPFAQALSVSGIGYKAATSVHAKILDFKHVSLGTSFQASYEHDPFREAFGLNPNIGVAGIYFDIGVQK